MKILEEISQESLRLVYIVALEFYKAEKGVEK